MQIMEPLIYNRDIKAVGISNGILPCLGGFTSMKDNPIKWDYGSSCSSDNPVVITPYEVAEIPRFMDRFPGGTQKTSRGSFGGSLSNNFCRDQVENSADQVENSAHSFSLKASSGEEDICSKNSRPVIDSDAWESSIIDLQLGRLSDSRTSTNCKVIHPLENLEMLESPLPTKRIKSTSLVGQTPLCQVLDCNMDLSPFKDYYKRHKVCEVHSKTARVIVNGMLQRFCQQCSRFHQLAEFDEGKRSCRKRLACHNERRRKSQIDIYPVRIARMMQPSYHGLSFSDSNISDINSLISPDVFAYNISREVKTENTNWLRFASSSENEAHNDIQVPVLHRHLLPGTRKHRFSNDINDAPRSTSYEHGNQYHLGFDTSSLNFDDIFNNNKGFPGISVSSSAHSLLSSQPQMSSFYPITIPVSTDQVIPQEENNILQTRTPTSSSYHQSGLNSMNFMVHNGQNDTVHLV